MNNYEPSNAMRGSSSWECWQCTGPRQQLSYWKVGFPSVRGTIIGGPHNKDFGVYTGVPLFRATAKLRISDVWGLGFRVSGFGICKVSALAFRMWGSGVRVKGLGVRGCLEGRVVSVKIGSQYAILLATRP